MWGRRNEKAQEDVKNMWNFMSYEGGREGGVLTLFFGLYHY